MVRAKGLNGYLRDDPSLSEKVTYEQFRRRTPAGTGRDYKLEDAYRSYQETLKEMEEDMDAYVWLEAEKQARQQNT